MKNLVIAFTLLASVSSFAREINVEGYTLNQALGLATCELVVQKPILIPKGYDTTLTGSILIIVKKLPDSEAPKVRRLAPGRKLILQSKTMSYLSKRAIKISDESVVAFRSSSENTLDMLVSEVFQASNGALKVSCTDDAPTDI